MCSASSQRVASNRFFTMVVFLLWFYSGTFLALVPGWNLNHPGPPAAENHPGLRRLAGRGLHLPPFLVFATINSTGLEFELLI